jgi:hypothetical protein
MEKAQAKVRRVFEGKRNIDETYIEKLDYFKLVVKETYLASCLSTILISCPLQRFCTCNDEELETLSHSRTLLDAASFLDPLVGLLSIACSACFASN